MKNPINQVYTPIRYKVAPLLNAEGCSSCHNAEGLEPNDGGFYNSAGAGGDTACALAHMFNKKKREECISRQRDKQGIKANTQQSEAELNSAMAQALLARQNGEGGMSTGKIVLWGGVGLALTAAIILVIRKMKKAKLAQ